MRFLDLQKPQCSGRVCVQIGCAIDHRTVGQAETQILGKQSAQGVDIARAHRFQQRVLGFVEAAPGDVSRGCDEETPSESEHPRRRAHPRRPAESLVRPERWIGKLRRGCDEGGRREDEDGIDQCMAPCSRPHAPGKLAPGAEDERGHQEVDRRSEHGSPGQVPLSAVCDEQWEMPGRPDGTDSEGGPPEPTIPSDAGPEESPPAELFTCCGEEGEQRHGENKQSGFAEGGIG